MENRLNKKQPTHRTQGGKILTEFVAPVVGEKITIYVSTGPYQGEYQVQVLDSNLTQIQVTMPLRGHGMIVPLAGGEPITVQYSGGNYRGQVLNRSFGTVHSLTITAPGSISLAGRATNEGARFVAVTSGKGGVGKSTFSLNLAFALVDAGLKVCLADVDLGTANLDLMLGVAVPTDLSDLLEQNKPLHEVLVPITNGLTLLPGSSGVGSIANLNNFQMSRLVTSFNQLSGNHDLIILDTGAGVGDNVTGFLQAADEVILVITPDPTAITDAYALLKVMKSKGDIASAWHLLVNRASGNEAEVIQANFCRTAFRHLGARITYLGSIPESQSIAMSVRRQQPFMVKGGGEEARSYQRVANKLVGLPNVKPGGFLQRFQEALLRFTE